MAADARALAAADRAEEPPLLVRCRGRDGASPSDPRGRREREPAMVAAPGTAPYADSRSATLGPRFDRWSGPVSTES